MTFDYTSRCNIKRLPSQPCTPFLETNMRLSILSIVSITLLFAIETRGSLTTSDRDTLNHHFPILSESWVQQSVDRCNMILANESYNSGDWEEYFSSYFSVRPLTDPLRTYLGYPVFWWFSDDVHRDLQNGLMRPFMTKIDTMIGLHMDTLSIWISNDVDARSTVRFCNEYLAYMLYRSHIDAASKARIDSFYTALINSYPGLLKSYITFNPATEPYLVSLRGQAQVPLLETRPLTNGRKDSLSVLFGLTGLRDSIFHHHGFLILDNNGFVDYSLAAIDDYFSAIPGGLWELDFVSAIDFWGASYTVWAEWAINVFAVQADQYQENSFPHEMSPVCMDGLMAVLAHEANHIVDAIGVGQNPVLTQRRNDLISRAGNDSLQYLRSMFDPGFFTVAPQEFFASIANEWFDNSEHTLRLGIDRFNRGYLEPVNQALFYSEVYSQGDASTYFYRTSPTGLVESIAIPVMRDINGRINQLTVSGTRYSFSLDAQGFVTSCTTSPNQTDTLRRVLVLGNDGDYVSVPDHDLLDIQGDFSLTAWIRTTASGFRRVISKDDGWPLPYWTLGIETGQLTLKLRNHQSFQVNITGGPQINDGQWHHVGFTVQESGSILLFADGGNVASGNHTGVFSNNAAFTIGSYCYYDQDFTGTIDELHAWNRALSAGEIIADRDNPGNPDASDLTGYWSFNDHGGLAWDSSPTAAHGTLIGNATRQIGTVPGESQTFFSFSFDECSGSIAHEYSGAFDLQLNGAAQWSTNSASGCAMDLRQTAALATATGGGAQIGNDWDDISIFAWVKLMNPLSTYSPIASRYSTHTNASFYLIAGNEAGNFGALYAKIYNGPGDTGVTLATQPGLISDTCWHYVGVTYQRNNQMTLWLDGEQAIAIATPDLPVKSTSEPLNVGANGSLGFGTNFDGYIDELVISRVQPPLPPYPVRCTPQIPDSVVMQIEPGIDVHLHWNPVTEDTCGGALCGPVYYILWYEATDGETLDFLGYTSDTTFTHAGVKAFETQMFYEVTTHNGPLSVITSATRDLGPHFSHREFEVYLAEEESRRYSIER